MIARQMQLVEDRALAAMVVVLASTGCALIVRLLLSLFCFFFLHPNQHYTLN